jgi:predicted nucleic acid-binding protein
VPIGVLRAWIEGRFELVVSRLLLAELERALAHPKLRKRIAATDAERFVDGLGTCRRPGHATAYPHARPPR